jgi:hypothetical protein
VTWDATPSRHDRQPRCGPCERHFDHGRRLHRGDRWYGWAIIDFAQLRYGDDWEREPGFEFCADLFADTRALGGWGAVGVELSSPRRKLEIETRPCPVCGQTTTSVSNYFCGMCHFHGWWGQWADEDDEQDQTRGRPKDPRRVVPGTRGREIVEQWVDYPEKGPYRPARRKLWYVVIDANGIAVTRSLRRDVAETYLS